MIQFSMLPCVYPDYYSKLYFLFLKGPMVMPKLRIALVSDYFYPNKGGLETHVRTVGEELVKLGHHVIVITHKYKGFKGCINVGKLTVYYLDIPVVIMNTTAPTIFTNYVIFNEIYSKNAIQYVHGHQSLSNLCLESIYHASKLNIKTILTDHSIFEISKFERILVNGICSYMCQNLDFAICVSSISKINTQLRIYLPENRIAVLPNGILPEYFYPKDDHIKTQRKIRLIFMSRLTYRKGIDLFIAAIPLICKDKNIEILVVGNGPKKCEIEQVISDNDLNDQITLLNEVQYEQVGDILRTGDIFLNTSLTETFCLAILEAAACGLVLVSTNVGGISEILPYGEILFCSPTPEDIELQIRNACSKLKNHNPKKNFELIKTKYNWTNITKQLVEIYIRIPSREKDKYYSIISGRQEKNSFLCRMASWYENLQMKVINALDRIYPST